MTPIFGSLPQNSCRPAHDLTILQPLVAGGMQVLYKERNIEAVSPQEATLTHMCITLG